MTGIERGLRRYLDNWRIWVGIAYFSLVAVVVWLFFLNRTLSNEQAQRAAEQAAANNSTLSACYQRAHNNPDMLAILDAIRRNSLNTIRSNRAAIAADPMSPLVKVRRASIQRSMAVVASINHFRDQIIAATPSEARCDALARQLNLPAQ